MSPKLILPRGSGDHQQIPSRTTGTTEEMVISLPLRVVTLVVAALVACTIVFTWASCVHLAHCPAPPQLPTISNTWTTPPGNYVSRFVVSVASLMLFAVQFALWLPSQKRSTFHRVVGCLAIFLLSWIGAICDDKNPQCLGLPEVHDCIAVAFFLLYDYNMIAFTLSHAHVSAQAAVSMAAPVLLSLVCKARWLPLGMLMPADDTALAIFEWLDVGCILCWTAGVAWTQRAEFVCLLDDAPHARAVCGINAQQTAYAVLGLFVATLGSSTLFYFAQGRAPPGTWPYISDTFVEIPGNLISRWGVVLAGSFAILAQLQLHILDARSALPAAWPMGDQALTTLAVVAVLGVMGVGCVNEREDHTLHIAFASVFFVGYDAYMLLRSLKLFSAAPPSSACVTLEPVSLRKPNPATSSRVPQLALALISTALTYVRFTSRFSATSGGGAPGELLLPILEWLDALSIVFYLTLAVLSHSKGSVAVGVCIAPATNL